MVEKNFQEIVGSLYELLGSGGQTRIDENEIQQHVDEIFQRIDPLRTDEINLEDFIEYCKKVRFSSAEEQLTPRGDDENDRLIIFLFVSH